MTPELSTLATFSIIQRPDGIGFAATSHDRSLLRNGIRYEAQATLQPLEMRLSGDVSDCSLSLSGALSSEGVSEADLRAGRWTDASIRLSNGDWRGMAAPTLLALGRLGPVKTQAGTIKATVDLAPESLGNLACPQTSPECRARLGDRSCGVDMRGRRVRSRVTAIDGDWIVTGVADAAPFVFGRLRWLTGSNSGLSYLVIDSSVEGRVRLRDRTAHPVVPGDNVMLEEGCDGRLQSCSQRFANVANFRGEPYLPGTDILTRYPGD